MQLQGLKRKSPNSRHYFGYRLNGELHSGLKSDYIKELNTVIRPDIDVSEDVKCINAGLAKNPVNEDISRDISAKIKKIRRNINLASLAISCVLFLLLDVNFVIITVITVIIWILAMFLNRKRLSSLVSIEHENNETQWEVNERVYGEHLNENGEYVLYPKRGDGFYCLSPLGYLNLSDTNGLCGGI